jgi:hypothetical protein
MKCVKFLAEIGFEGDNGFWVRVEGEDGRFLTV